MTIVQPTTSFVPVLGRIVWMMLGPLALVLLAVRIAYLGQGWLTGVDVAFLAVLGGVILARWLEFRGGNPQTATGEPATPDHLRRYSLAVLAVGLAVWVLANLLGNHWLSR